MRIQQAQWNSSAGWERPLATLGADRAQVVFLFAAGEVALAPGWLSSVRTAFPRAHVLGCTTGGEIHGARVTDNAAVLTCVEFDSARVRTATVSAQANDSFAAGERLIAQLDPTGLRHVFILSDGLQVNPSDLLAGVNKALPVGTTVSGGFAADANRFQQTHVWCDSEPLRSSAVALGFYGDQLRIGVSATGGWGPFGPDRLITRSAKNVLFEVDGRPILSLYKEYLGEYASQLPEIGLMFPLELRDPAGEYRVLRALIAMNEQEQSITFAGNVPQGWFCRFMVGDIEDLIQSTHTAAQQSVRDLAGAEPELSLIVSCNARRAVLKQRVEEEIDAARNVLGANTPLTGFYSYGEIAGGQGDNCELHNETMSITSLRES